VKEGEAGVKEGEAGVKEGEAGVKEGEAGVKEGEAGVKEGEGEAKKGEGRGCVEYLEPRVCVLVAAHVNWQEHEVDRTRCQENDAEANVSKKLAVAHQASNFTSQLTGISAALVRP
jgi:hypothetical protein